MAKLIKQRVKKEKDEFFSRLSSYVTKAHENHKDLIDQIAVMEDENEDEEIPKKKRSRKNKEESSDDVPKRKKGQKIERKKSVEREEPKEVKKKGSKKKEDFKSAPSSSQPHSQTVTQAQPEDNEIRSPSPEVKEEDADAGESYSEESTIKIYEAIQAAPRIHEIKLQIAEYMNDPGVLTEHKDHISLHVKNAIAKEKKLKRMKLMEQQAAAETTPVAEGSTAETAPVSETKKIGPMTPDPEIKPMVSEAVPPVEVVPVDVASLVAHPPPPINFLPQMPYIQPESIYTHPPMFVPTMAPPGIPMMPPMGYPGLVPVFNAFVPPPPVPMPMGMPMPMQMPMPMPIPMSMPPPAPPPMVPAPTGSKPNVDQAQASDELDASAEFDHNEELPPYMLAEMAMVSHQNEQPENEAAESNPTAIAVIGHSKTMNVAPPPPPVVSNTGAKVSHGQAGFLNLNDPIHYATPIVSRDEVEPIPEELLAGSSIEPIPEELLRTMKSHHTIPAFVPPTKLRDVEVAPIPKELQLETVFRNRIAKQAGVRVPPRPKTPEEEEEEIDYMELIKSGEIAPIPPELMMVPVDIPQLPQSYEMHCFKRTEDDREEMHKIMNEQCKVYEQEQRMKTIPKNSVNIMSQKLNKHTPHSVKLWHAKELSRNTKITVDEAMLIIDRRIAQEDGKSGADGSQDDQPSSSSIRAPVPLMANAYNPPPSFNSEEPPRRRKRGGVKERAKRQYRQKMERLEAEALRRGIDPESYKEKFREKYNQQRYEEENRRRPYTPIDDEVERADDTYNEKSMNEDDIGDGPKSPESSSPPPPPPPVPVAAESTPDKSDLSAVSMLLRSPPPPPPPPPLPPKFDMASSSSTSSVPLPVPPPMPPTAPIPPPPPSLKNFPMPPKFFSAPPAPPPPPSGNDLLISPPKPPGLPPPSFPPKYPTSGPPKPPPYMNPAQSQDFFNYNNPPKPKGNNNTPPGPPIRPPQFSGGKKPLMSSVPPPVPPPPNFFGNNSQPYGWNSGPPTPQRGGRGGQRGGHFNRNEYQGRGGRQPYNGPRNQNDNKNWRGGRGNSNMY